MQPHVTSPKAVHLAQDSELSLQVVMDGLDLEK